MKCLKLFLMLLIAVATILISLFNLWAASANCYSDAICQSYAEIVCDIECRSYLRECLSIWAISNWCCHPGVCCTAWQFYCAPPMWIKGYSCSSYHWACVENR